MTIFQPYNLVSLWDIMQEFNSKNILTPLVAITKILSTVGKVPLDQQFRLRKDLYLRLLACLKSITDELKSLDAVVSLAAAQKLENALKNCQGATENDLEYIVWEIGRHKSIETQMDQLVSRVPDELAAKKFFIVPSEQAFYYEGALEKWKFVTDKHPDLTEDIDEAGKCIALARPTATVFHLMRITETGVKLFGAALGVQDYEEKQWNKILEKVETEIEKRWPSHGKQLNSAEKEDRQQYNEALSYLRNVKLAWRNDTMHPKTTYTLEESKKIYAATLAFIEDLVGLT